MGIYNLQSKDTTYVILGKAYPSKRWSWSFEKENYRFLYHTNNMGEGVFCYDTLTGEESQLTGTCQFSACSSVSGMRKKIKRFFDWYNG